MTMHVLTVSLESSDGRRREKLSTGETTAKSGSTLLLAVPPRTRHPCPCPSTKSCGSVTFQFSSQPPGGLDDSIAPCVVAFKRDCTYISPSCCAFCAARHQTRVIAHLRLSDPRSRPVGSDPRSRAMGSDPRFVFSDPPTCLTITMQFDLMTCHFQADRKLIPSLFTKISNAFIVMLA